MKKSICTVLQMIMMATAFAGDKEVSISGKVQDDLGKAFQGVPVILTRISDRTWVKADVRGIIAFADRFGNKLSASFRQRSGGAEEERRRAGRGSA